MLDVSVLEIKSIFFICHESDCIAFCEVFIDRDKSKLIDKYKYDELSVNY